MVPSAPARLALAVLAAALLAASGVAAAATPRPLGAELEVNAYIELGPAAPRVSAGDSGFVVVWQSFGSSGSDDSNFSVQARRYDGDGVARGAEFQVNEETTFGQRYPDVAVDADGAFVVVWETSVAVPGDPAPRSVQGRRFDADGLPLATQIQVNAYTTDSQLRPAVVGTGDGAFVVVWQSVYRGDGGAVLDYDVYARAFDAAGAPLSGEGIVHEIREGDQASAALAAVPSGGAIVVWQGGADTDCDGDGSCIEARRLDADGVPLAASFAVNAYTSGPQVAPSLAVAADGAFLVAWSALQGFGDDPPGSARVEARRFASDGTPLGPDFQVSTGGFGYQGGARVTALADRSFALAWTSESSSGDDDDDETSVQLRIVGASGALGAPERQMNVYVKDFQVDPAIAASPGGGWMATAWNAVSVFDSDLTPSFVRARPFTAPTPIFADGFEEGDTDGWSAVAP